MKWKRQSKPLIRGLGFNCVFVLDKGVKHEGQQWGADHELELDQLLQTADFGKPAGPKSAEHALPKPHQFLPSHRIA